MINEFIVSLIAMFVIITPFSSLLAFIAMTKGCSEKQKSKDALIAVSVAFSLLVIFLFAGHPLLNAMGISMYSFKAGGGVILLLLGIQQVMGKESGKKHERKDMVGVVIGTPLLTGPGAITTITILSGQYGFAIPLAASFIVLAITWVMLRYSVVIEKIVGRIIIEVMAKVFGLIITAIAVQFMVDGFKGMGLF